MGLEVKALVAKLNKVNRRALEGAAQLCVSQTHFNVEIEHLLMRLVELPDGEVRRILRNYDVEVATVEAELTAAMAKLQRGNGRTPALSPHVPVLLEEAWLLSSVLLESPTIRSGAILLALLERDVLRSLVTESCPILLRLPRDKMRQDLRELVRGSAEDEKAPRQPARLADEGGAPAAAYGGGAPAGASAALDQFTVDLTAEARAGKIDPIKGRDGEIRQIIDILMRRRQNNPILTGEAGVGKTAVVEGLALRIAAGDVPPPLRAVSIRALDLGLLQAGAGVKGEFENRLKSVIAEAAGAAHPVVLFIDEAHTLIGAGGPAGQGDAANLLKPALARGEVRTIAATTWSEYKKYFEKDPALARRFQVVKVAEPDEPTAEVMLRALAPKLETHHKVRILDEAVSAAVRLSHRYITGRLLPDKAVSVLDTACARVAVGRAATPPSLEAADRLSRQLSDEIGQLERELRLGHDHGERIAALQRDLEAAGAEFVRLERQWQDERTLTDEILGVLGEIEQLGMEGVAGAALAAQRTRLERLRERLSVMQGETPMVPLWVDAKVVASVISGWTGIPVGSMMRDEIAMMLDLEARMGERVVGQPQALAAVARRIRTYRANLGEPSKPVGVFLLVGPSGIGKTETGATLAELLYGGERNLIVINMSEYQEPHSVASLKGSPPGYVGYGTGGVLTEAVRRNPYSVLLLDEVEKAHPDVMDLFYQVFDKGTLEDGEGVEVDFKNTIILLTSNLGSECILELCQAPAEPPATEAVVEALRPILLRQFKPALLARLVVVPYYPLGDDVIRRIVGLKLAKLRQRMREQHRAELVFADRVAAAIAARCIEVDSGARNIEHILTNGIMPRLSEEILARMVSAEPFDLVRVDADADGGFTYDFALAAKS
jgi:type VI secretion system protein VasG